MAASSPRDGDGPSLAAARVVVVARERAPASRGIRAVSQSPAASAVAATVPAARSWSVPMLSALLIPCWSVTRRATHWRPLVSSCHASDASATRKLLS